MIRIKDNKQLDMFDPWDFLSPKRRRMLDEDWPGLFKQHLLYELPVDLIRPFFTSGFGRPSKELYTLLGTLFLQQAMDLNDYETARQLSFNIEWHYALNITEESDQAKYICEKTLWSWRQTFLEHNLDQVIFDRFSDKLAFVFKVDTDEQRIDSVHIKSNMRKLGRIGIFSQSINKFLVNLKRHHKELYASVPDQLVQRYASQKALGAFSLVKPSQAAKTLQQVSADLYDLIEQFKDQDAVCTMNSYKLMQRVLNEQCNVEIDGDTASVNVKAPKQIPCDSLQNPSDPDATYSGHKGQGYQVQIMETFTRCEDEEEKEQTLNLITYVAVEEACEHDSNALMPAIEECQKRDLGPKTVLADTLYGSDDNERAAKAVEVDVVAPTFKGGKSEGMDLSSFSFDDTGEVISCPAGHKPLEVNHKKKTDRFSACFDSNLCQACPYAEQCPAQAGKKGHFVRYSAKDYRLAVRRAAEASEDFIDTYRWRAGVEATMSQYDRLTGVKRLRVRGFKAVRYCATLKAAGLNMLRAAKVRKARLKAQKGRNAACHWPLYMPFPIVRERICSIFVNMGRFCLAQLGWADFYEKVAA
jgi:hypothetical protein